MKTLVRVLLIASLLIYPCIPAVRTNQVVTIAATVPVRLSTSCGNPVSSIFIQMVHGGTGIGYVMAGIGANRTPVATTASDLTAELAPATATSPGGAVLLDDQGGIDPCTVWIDGSHTADTVLVSIVQ